MNAQELAAYDKSLNENLNLEADKDEKFIQIGYEKGLEAAELDLDMNLHAVGEGSVTQWADGYYFAKRSALEHLRALKDKP